MTATDIEKRKNIEGVIFLILFCLTIPAANWMIGHIGTVCLADGPCLIPVAPGVMAPSGVLMIGAALVLRDLVQRRLGVEFGIGAIVAGAAISAALAPAALVIASAAALAFAMLITRGTAQRQEPEIFAVFCEKVKADRKHLFCRLVGALHTDIFRHCLLGQVAATISYFLFFPAKRPTSSIISRKGREVFCAIFLQSSNSGELFIRSWPQTEVLTLT